ncbi:hypothetical protein SDC9_145593 [bioreactor metagenome]|uniref:Uncharacterized protein n=1 Tax=bioreactor metagenome TaxID=1076179 RepID=A0A645E916_9ZZZZ
MTAIPTETTITTPSLETSPPVTASTCPANICRSGSATEIKKPSSSPAATTTQTRLNFTTADPISFPKGSSPTSSPSKKTDNPKIISSAPSKNRASLRPSTGVRVQLRISTIATTGTIDNEASFIFCFNTCNRFTSLLVSSFHTL